jgi:hypothetical protein
MDGPTAEGRFRVAFIVWASVLGGITIFAAVVWGAASGYFGPIVWESLTPGTAYKLLVLAIVPMVAGIAWRHREVGSRDDPDRRLVGWQARVIVASALQEAGGLFALGLCRLVARPNWVLGVWLATAAAMLLIRPRREELDQLLR